jgi:hypothetical protein
MAEKPGKYAAALATINQMPEPKNHIALPMKPEPPRGKRSTAGLEAEGCLTQRRKHPASRPIA